MGVALRKPQQSEPTLLQTKSLCYTIVKNSPKILLPHSETEKRKLENFDLLSVSSSSFFFLLLSSSSCVTQNHREHMNILQVKRMLYYRRGAFSGLDLYADHDWCVIIQNTHGSLLSRRHFVLTFGHNPQTIGGILAFYIPNDLATTGDVASQF